MEYNKHGGRKPRAREYQAYMNAKYRCTNPKCADYKYYGGRGVKFLFKSFAQFIAEIGPRPTSQHTLDRIRNNEHYEPGNVRWANHKVQQNNRRNSVPKETALEVVQMRERGFTYPQIEKALGIPVGTGPYLLRREGLHADNE
jgi:hypothetical protein